MLWFYISTVLNKRLSDAAANSCALERKNRTGAEALLANCPLIWSQYGDQHLDVCIGYSVPSDVHNDLHRVKYGGKQLVDPSKVLAMLDGDKDAPRQVDEAAS
ncbi:hypothetical protein IVA98_30465 [Bradyrhizobium sp. 160]|uniref:hypothetical protein n=1 Tax=Bradyrhizobium sp. 160 TaxID=2782634 RepID=UPI001FFA5E58|nr:hypothetical protein [Bradyrhizobium sp. 160]MCK1627364.1 hypothetical protein [Bradyrhizobium sp. 160]